MIKSQFLLGLTDDDLYVNLIQRVRVLALEVMMIDLKKRSLHCLVLFFFLSTTSLSPIVNSSYLAKQHLAQQSLFQVESFKPALVKPDGSLADYSFLKEPLSLPSFTAPFQTVKKVGKWLVPFVVGAGLFVFLFPLTNDVLTINLTVVFVFTLIGFLYYARGKVKEKFIALALVLLTAIGCSSIAQKIQPERTKKWHYLVRQAFEEPQGFDVDYRKLNKKSYAAWEAIQALFKVKNPTLEQKLAQKEILISLFYMLKDRDFSHSARSVFSILSASKEKVEFFPEIKTFLKDSNVEVQYNAVLVLTDLMQENAAEMIPKLIPLLDNSTDENLFLRQKLAESLWKLGPNDSRIVSKYLDIAETHLDSSVRLNAVANLYRFTANKEKRIALFKKIIKSEDENKWDDNFKKEAIRGLNEMGAEDEEIVSLFINMLNSQDQNLRMEAMDALNKMKPTMEQLIQAYHFKYTYVQSWAVGAVRKHYLDDPQAASFLMQALQNQDISISKLAIQGMGELKVKQARVVPVLMKIFKSNWAFVLRLEAARSLKKLGRQARSVAGDLVKTFGDPSPEIRSAAADVLLYVADQQTLKDLVIHHFDKDLSKLDDRSLEQIFKKVGPEIYVLILDQFIKKKISTRALEVLSEVHFEKSKLEGIFKNVSKKNRDKYQKIFLDLLKHRFNSMNKLGELGLIALKKESIKPMKEFLKTEAGYVKNIIRQHPQTYYTDQKILLKINIHFMRIFSALEILSRIREPEAINIVLDSLPQSDIPGSYQDAVRKSLIDSLDPLMIDILISRLNKDYNETYRLLLLKMLETIESQPPKGIQPQKVYQKIFNLLIVETGSSKERKVLRIAFLNLAQVLKKSSKDKLIGFKKEFVKRLHSYMTKNDYILLSRELAEALILLDKEDVLLELLKNPNLNSYARRQIMEKLARQINQTAVFEFFVQILREAGSVRYQSVDRAILQLALDALGNIKNQKQRALAVSVIHKVLEKDQRRTIQIAAIRSLLILEQQNDPALRTDSLTLIRGVFLKTRSSKVRVEVVKALGQLEAGTSNVSKQESLIIIRQALKELKRIDHQRSAMIALVKVLDQEAFPEIQKMYQTDRPRFIKMYLETLVLMKNSAELMRILREDILDASSSYFNTILRRIKKLAGQNFKQASEIQHLLEKEIVNEKDPGKVKQYNETLKKVIEKKQTFQKKKEPKTKKVGKLEQKKKLFKVVLKHSNPRLLTALAENKNNQLFTMLHLIRKDMNNVQNAKAVSGLILTLSDLIDFEPQHPEVATIKSTLESCLKSSIPPISLAAVQALARLAQNRQIKSNTLIDFQEEQVVSPLINSAI